MKKPSKSHTKTPTYKQVTNSQDIRNFKLFISMFREKIGRALKKSEMTEISSWWFRGMNCIEAIKQVLERHQNKQSFNYYKANLWRDYNELTGQVYKKEPTNMKAIMQEIAKR